MYKLSVKLDKGWVDYLKSNNLPELEKESTKLEMEGKKTKISKF